MKTDLFDYHLPDEQIAQCSVEPRDHSRLMVVSRKTGDFEHKQFFEIVAELRAGDVLVFNDTKVFRARMRGQLMKAIGGPASVAAPRRCSLRCAPSGTPPPAAPIAAVELFLLRCVGGQVWETLVRPGRKVREGDTLIFGDWDMLYGTIKEKRDDGVVLVEFDCPAEQVIAYANVHGEIPVPPYVKEQPRALEQYQTIYARHTGSVAAPTAGFHFTQRLLDELKVKGVQFEFVTLHVGMGTFRPVKSGTLEEHKMHSEFVSLDEQTAKHINQAKKEGRRVIAVGTTTVRTLEGISALSPISALSAFSGDLNLFIKPGFTFKVIDGLITNFHLPKSTLLVLVSAFAGREQILRAYEEAVKQKYRFFSFGDAMFIR